MNGYSVSQGRQLALSDTRTTASWPLSPQLSLLLVLRAASLAYWWAGCSLTMVSVGKLRQSRTKADRGA